MENNLQKKYTINSAAILVVCIFLIAYTAISIFSNIYYYWFISLWVTLATIFIFSVTGLFFQASNKNHSLRLPLFMPKKLIICLQIITGIAFFVSMIYAGTFSPPQIWQIGDAFRDRAGHQYTYVQFIESQKHQLINFTLFSIFCLISTITIPFYDKQAKKWIFP